MDTPERELFALAQVDDLGPPAPGPHPDDDALRAFRAGELGETEHASLEAHLADCAHCLDQLVAVSGVVPQAPTLPDELLHQVETRVAAERATPEQAPEQPGWWARLKAALAPPGRWMPLAGAAAAAVALILVWPGQPPQRSIDAVRVAGADRLRGAEDFGQEGLFRPGQDLRVFVRAQPGWHVATFVIDASGRQVAPIATHQLSADSDRRTFTRQDVGTALEAAGVYRVVVLAGPELAVDELRRAAGDLAQLESAARDLRLALAVASFEVPSE